MGKILSTPMLPDILRTVNVARCTCTMTLKHNTTILLYSFLVAFNNFIMYRNRITGFEFGIFFFCGEIDFQQLLIKSMILYFISFVFQNSGRNITNNFLQNTGLTAVIFNAHGNQNGKSSG